MGYAEGNGVVPEEFEVDKNTGRGQQNHQDAPGLGEAHYGAIPPASFAFQSSNRNSRAVSRIARRKIIDSSIGPSPCLQGVVQPHLVPCPRLCDELLRRMVIDFDGSAGLTLTNPKNRLVHKNPDGINAFQVDYLSTLWAG